MKACEFDKAFDAGNDVAEAIAWSKAHRPNQQTVLQVPTRNGEDAGA